MNTCATCRFFGSPMPLSWSEDDDAYDDHETGHHACARIIHGNETGSGTTSKAKAIEIAVVTDGSGYAARLRVLPTFGCVLHEPRP